MVGMLHDLDYERYPDLHTGHPRYALAELERLEFPEDMVRAVASHADYLEVSRDTPMEKTLFAVDELSGFVMACAYVRPDGIDGLTPKSVKKKMKTPAFAAAVDREAMREGAEMLGIDFDEHLAFVIAALEPHADELGPRRRSAASLAPPWRTAEDHRPRGRRDRPGAARAVRPGARPRAARPRARAGHYDLSLEKRRETGNEIVHEAARAMREAGFGLKAATVTPEGKDDVGSPNRILREEVDGKVIVRTGRRIPGVVGPGLGRLSPDLRRADGRRRRLRRQAVARGRGRRGGRLPDAEDHARDLPRGRRVLVPYGRADRRQGLRRARSGPSRRSTRACSRRRWTRPPPSTRTSRTSRC